jgi:5-methylthioribose kinase
MDSKAKFNDPLCLRIAKVQKTFEAFFKDWNKKHDNNQLKKNGKFNFQKYLTNILDKMVQQGCEAFILKVRLG